MNYKSPSCNSKPFRMPTIKRHVFLFLVAFAISIYARMPESLDIEVEWNRKSLRDQPWDPLPWLHVRQVNKNTHPNSYRDYVIADEWDREVFLRGVNFNLEQRKDRPYVFPNSPAAYLGKCPANTASHYAPPLCQVDAGKGRFHANTTYLSQNDYAQARALGFTMIRLCLSWSEIEREPGVYDTEYLDRIEQLVDWAEEQGMYTILDMHQDIYSLSINAMTPSEKTGGILNTWQLNGLPPLLFPGHGDDGAPPWAVITQGWPAITPLNIKEANLAVLQAFEAFWANMVIPGIPQGEAPGPGIQDHFIGAVAAIARRFSDRSAVAGYELLNEPLAGTTGLLRPYSFSRNQLYPFYKRVVQAITGVRDSLPTCVSTEYAYPKVGKARGATGSGSDPTCAYPDLGIRDTKHLIFTEPHAIRNVVDYSMHESLPWTEYPNIVHSPHVYTTMKSSPQHRHILQFTVEKQVPLLAWFIYESPYPPSFRYAYENAYIEANQMRSAVYITEFGCGSSDNDDRTVLKQAFDAQDELLISSTLWTWKTNCNLGPTNCKGGAWTVYSPASGALYGPMDQNGEIYEFRERLISRMHPRALVGEITHFYYNPTSEPPTFELLAIASDRDVVRRASDDGVSDASDTFADPIEVIYLLREWVGNLGKQSSHYALSDLCHLAYGRTGDRQGWSQPSTTQSRMSHHSISNLDLCLYLTAKNITIRHTSSAHLNAHAQVEAKLESMYLPQRNPQIPRFERHLDQLEEHTCDGASQDHYDFADCLHKANARQMTLQFDNLTLSSHAQNYHTHFKAPLRLVLNPDDFLPTLPRLFAANGTVSEIYIPRNWTENSEYYPIGSSDVFLEVLWPDESASIYFRPTEVGYYGVSVNIEGAVVEAAHGLVASYISSMNQPRKSFHKLIINEDGVKVSDVCLEFPCQVNRRSNMSSFGKERTSSNFSFSKLWTKLTYLPSAIRASLESTFYGIPSKVI